MKENILKVEDVMVILDIKKTTFYKIMASPSRIPFVEIGNKKIISETKFYEWLHDNEGKKLY